MRHSTCKRSTRDYSPCTIPDKPRSNCKRSSCDCNPRPMIPAKLPSNCATYSCDCLRPHSRRTTHDRQYKIYKISDNVYRK